MKRKLSYLVSAVFLVLLVVGLSGCKTESADTYDPNHEIIRMALEANDPMLCEQIALQSGVNSRDTCYSILALANKDLSLCENVAGVTTTDSGEITKQVCVEKVTSAMERDEKIIEAKEIYDEAFEDPTACNKFGDAIARDVCLENSAVNNKDESICDGMTNLDGKQECFFRVALLNSDKSVCEKLTLSSGKYSKDVCFGSIAVNLLDPEVCEEISVISGPFSRDACFGSIAVVTKESALCDRIVAETGDLSKDFCFDMLMQS
ncbi:hypothetical protein KY335_03235 [Candidatus Woesearchaeota archaeon]|nr:hypothetical protein [Candidatus Woesearchaeota archaeon]